ncbi:MAG: hypothetical protein ABSH15_15255 [Verrucomicrobiota bacterium]|jgi:hypothetical protein
MKSLNIKTSLALVALAIISTSCATPPRTFHNYDNTALVIESLDYQTCRMLRPDASASEDNDKFLARAATLSKGETAVVILENYTESQIGDQFRDRGTYWLVSLRNLGYRHVVLLQGQGIADPEGLKILADYD